MVHVNEAEQKHASVFIKQWKKSKLSIDNFVDYGRWTSGLLPFGKQILNVFIILYFYGDTQRQNCRTISLKVL